MKKIILCLAATAALFIVACDNAKKDKSEPTVVTKNDGDTGTRMEATPPENDAPFATFAADGGMMEVEAGKLAQTKGSAKAVKDAGKMIATDHQKANDELKALAAKLSISLPTSMSAEHQAKYDALAAKTGADFDMAFLDAMEEGHKETIRRFEDEANNGRQAELKQWASDKLPTLRHHLEMVEAAKKSMKK